MLVTSALFQHKFYRVGRRQSIKRELMEEKKSTDKRFEYYNGVDAVLIFVFPLGFLIFNCFYWYYYTMKL